MKINPDVIIDEICEYYDIDRLLLKSSSRKRSIIKPRHQIMLFMRIHTDFRHEDISKYFNRKRANVTHGLRRANDRLFQGADPEFRKEYFEIKYILTGKREPATDEIFMENDLYES